MYGRDVAAHVMVSEPPQFLINQRGQFRESGIVSLTPSLQEIGHSLLRDRKHIHNPPLSHASTRRSLGASSAFEKNLNPNEHFHGPFSFMTTKDESQKHEDLAMNPLTHFKKTSHAPTSRSHWRSSRLRRLRSRARTP